MFDTNTRTIFRNCIIAICCLLSTALTASAGAALNASDSIAPKNPSVKKFQETQWQKNAVIYEVNVRQFNQDGTFRSFAPEIPRIKSLGADVLWFMPIYPIGELNRKGGLGSYYSIKDYRGINPEFGNLNDFKMVVQFAHANGMKVILDWVGNHTAWDHPWIKAHPDWYVHDSTGKIVTPWDWTDVAQLNFKNPELRKAMIAEMQYWVDECDIDGFRCDVAFLVPKDFWEEARVAIEKRKMMFMLAEMELNTDVDKNPASYCDKAFDAYYGWSLHGASADCAKGKITGKEFITKATESRAKWPAESMMMSFLTNHDENTWNGTVEEKYGDKWQVFSVLNYTLPGSFPLIYNGEEANNTKRLKFFEKDPITTWNDTLRYDWYRKMNALKHTQPALANGPWGADAEVLKVTGGNENVYAFRRTNLRTKNGKSVTVIVNLDSTQQWIQAIGDRVLDGTEATYVASPTNIKHLGLGRPIGPWGYVVIVD